LGFDGRVNADSVARVTDRKANELARHRLQAGNLVLPRRGEINKRALMTDLEEGWLCGTGCIKVALQGNELLPKYLYYYLGLHTTVRWLEQHAVGTTMLNLSASIVRSLPVQLPPIEAQERIASILSAYDDLIENNKRRIQLLEQAARLLYQEWFVRLRFPGYEQTRIVDGVPEGWEWTQLGNVAAVNKEQLSERFHGVINYVDISSVSSGTINEIQRFDFEDAPGRARRVLHHGDIVWSCVRPNRRSYAVIWNPQQNMIASTGFAVLSPILLPTSYLYYATTIDSFVGYLVNRTRGAAYPAVLAIDFENAAILKPNDRISEDFDKIVSPMIAQKANLDLQNQRLRQARDLLLPKLMTGEIEV